MSVIATGKKTHDDAANASEATRQSAVRAAGVTQRPSPRLRFCTTKTSWRRRERTTTARTLQLRSRRCVISGREVVMGHG